MGLILPTITEPQQKLLLLLLLLILIAIIIIKSRTNNFSVLFPCLNCIDVTLFTHGLSGGQ